MQHPALPLNRKTPPSPYLNSGWEKAGNGAIWHWHTSPQSTLSFTSPCGDICYFMAEVSALCEEQSTTPHTITLAINGFLADEWTIDSTTVHDKFIIIPQGLIKEGAPVVVTLSASDLRRGGASDIGMNLHSIALHDNLDAYLRELQTGYNWACGVRNELMETLRRVLHFLDNIDSPPSQIVTPLKTILQDPYVLGGDEAALAFDKNYFQANLPRLKEGRIHQAIRQWATDLKNLQTEVVEAGNYATSRPEIRCWDQMELNKTLPPPLEFSEKFTALRAKNTVLNNLEILLHKDRIDSVPPVLYLDITNRCNFRCRMCYQSTSLFLRQNLTNEHMAVILGMIPYLSEITVAGLGEPLLSKNLLSLAERAHALRCATTIITNGSLIPTNIHILKHFSTISISFDGAEATTFETLRNRSNFRQITSNIRKLRDAASDITLAFSVVLSRANLDEFSGIVRWAAELGINTVNVSPLEHMPIFELKKSDFPLFQTQLTEAQHIAGQAGITLSVAIAIQNFSSSNDTPRDKKGLIDALAAMKPAQEQIPQLEDIVQGLHSIPFNYYPDPIVFMLPSWPQTTSPVPATTKATPHASSNFEIDLELTRLDQRISACLNEIRSQPIESLTLPYCLDPWKLNYVKSNGASRLCCHTDHIVGDLGNHGFRAAINSQRYRRIRKTMTGRQPLLPVCKQCQAADRALGLESITDTCHAYGITLTTPTIDLQGSSDAGQ